MLGYVQVARLTVGVGFLLMFGCRSPPDVALLSVTAVDPPQLEPAGTLTVQGAGFASGRSCRVTLAGVTRRPGARARSVHLELEGYAQTDERVTVVLDPAAFAALGDHGTLHGEISVAFEAPHGGQVSGRVPLILDLVHPMALGAAHREALRARAQTLLAFVGLVLVTDSPTSDGLVVDWAAEQSVAARAGLSQGDVIVRSSGVGLHSLADFAPAPGATSLQLEVAHSDGSLRTRELPLHGYAGPDLDRMLWRMSALGLGLLLCLAFLSPLPSPPQWLARIRLRRKTTSSPGLWGGRLATRRSRRFAVGVALSVSLWATLLIYAAPAAMLRIGPASLYFALAATGLTLPLLGSRPLSTRIRVARGNLLPVLGLGVVIACACTLFGARSLAGVVEEQGPWPWQWGLYQQPALFFAFPLFVSCSVQLGMRGEQVGELARGSSWQAVATNMALAALGAAIFCGGSQWPASLAFEGVPQHLLGSALWVAKSWLLAWLLHLGRRAATHPPRWWSIILSAAVVAATSVLWLWWRPVPEITLAIGMTLSAATLISLVLSLLTLWRMQARERRPGETHSPLAAAPYP